MWPIVWKSALWHTRGRVKQNSVRNFFLIGFILLDFLYPFYVKICIVMAFLWSYDVIILLSALVELILIDASDTCSLWTSMNFIVCFLHFIFNSVVVMTTRQLRGLYFISQKLDKI